MNNCKKYAETDRVLSLRHINHSCTPFESNTGIFNETHCSKTDILVITYFFCTRLLDMTIFARKFLPKIDGNFHKNLHISKSDIDIPLKLGQNVA